MIIRLLAAGLGAGMVLLAVSPAAGQSDTHKAEKKICRSSVATGSILKNRRECHTAAEWRERDAETAHDTRDFRDNQRANSSRSISTLRD